MGALRPCGPHPIRPLLFSVRGRGDYGQRICELASGAGSIRMPPSYPHALDSRPRVRQSGRQTIVTMPNIPFTNNYTDLSSQRGFQFKFFCEKCGNGYMSSFHANKLGLAAAAADAAGSLLGGLFGRAAQTAQSLQSMAAGPQHDAALDAAVKEISPLFKQCTRCGKWVCEPVCWNKKVGLCENCAPDLDEEIAAAEESITEATGATSSGFRGPGYSLFL